MQHIPLWNVQLTHSLNHIQGDSIHFALNPDINVSVPW